MTRGKGRGCWGSGRQEPVGDPADPPGALTGWGGAQSRVVAGQAAPSWRLHAVRIYPLPWLCTPRARWGSWVHVASAGAGTSSWHRDVELASSSGLLSSSSLSRAHVDFVFPVIRDTKHPLTSPRGLPSVVWPLHGFSLFFT